MATPEPQETPSAKQPPLFELGQVVATPGALSACSEEYLSLCLGRHVRGDWGSVCDDDKETNDQALIDGNRIISAYPINPREPCQDLGDNRLWIITEWDRSATTFLLPDEY
jgi:hypothetical protein